jgi:hypothetical protein
MHDEEAFLTLAVDTHEQSSKKWSHLGVPASGIMDGLASRQRLLNGMKRKNNIKTDLTETVWGGGL